jgi:hypothetical protein
LFSTDTDGDGTFDAIQIQNWINGGALGP